MIPRFGKSALVSALMMFALASTAVAQGDLAAQCDADEATPQDIGRAMIQLNAAQGAATPEAAAAALRNGIGYLTAATSSVNPAGRAFVLGKTLVWFIKLEGTPYVTTRGNLGYKTNPAGEINIVNEIDSLFNIVTAAHPKCAPLLDVWRRLDGWVRLLNGAIAQMNADSVDAAEKSARMALKLSSATPYGHLVMAQVMTKREKPAEAIAFYKAAIAEASKDTTFAPVAVNALYQMASLAYDASQTAKTAEEKQMFGKEAVAAFEALTKHPSAPVETRNAAEQNMVRAMLGMGDSASVKAKVQNYIDNITKYDFGALIQAGAIAAEAKWHPEAIKLFEAATAANPFHRDGMFNLARLYVLEKREREALPILEKLVATDPNGYENYRLTMIALSSIQSPMAKRLNEMTARRDAMPTTGTAALQRRAVVNDSAKALGDSTKGVVDRLIKTQMKADSLVARVTFTEFSPGADKTTLGGFIDNPTATDRTYAVKFEFLDATGKVITTADASVKAAAKGRGEFKVEGKAPGIKAFRYAEIK